MKAAFIVGKLNNNVTVEDFLRRNQEVQKVNKNSRKILNEDFLRFYYAAEGYQPAKQKKKEPNKKKLIVIVVVTRYNCGWYRTEHNTHACVFDKGNKEHWLKVFPLC